MAFDGESFDGSEKYVEEGGDPSGYRAALQRALAKRKAKMRIEDMLANDGPGGPLVTVTLSAYAWGHILDALAHLTALRGSFYDQGMAAELFELVELRSTVAP